MLEAEAFDEVAFNELAEALGADVIGEAVAVFLDEVGKQMRRLAEFEAAGDRAGMSLAAHAIKGSAGTIGLMALATAAGLLEEAAQANQRIAWRPLISAMEHTFVEGRRLMAARLAGIAAAA